MSRKKLAISEERSTFLVFFWALQARLSASSKLEVSSLCIWLVVDCTGRKEGWRAKRGVSSAERRLLAEAAGEVAGGGGGQVGPRR